MCAMKKTMMTLLAMLLLVAVPSRSQTKKPVFTTIKANAITPVKNQNKSGTCWSFATCAFFEGEILRKTGKTYNLAEMFVASKDYVDCAEYHVRMHGNSRFSEGGSCDDVLSVIRRHGICPESAMPVQGMLPGDTLANFKEFFSVLEPYVKAVASSDSKRLTPRWKEGLQGILDSYLGKCPEHFEYESKCYTPQSFAASLGLDWDDYVSITSFTHHPFYADFVIEAPYKWRPCPSYNVPLDEMMNIIDTALDKGYNVAWGGDVSEVGFTRRGLGIACQNDSDFAKLGFESPELEVSQELRQERFDNWQSTYDHVMLIFGKAKDQNGREYYMVKNSWGTKSNDFEGIWYMSRAYIALNTTYIFLNRNACPKGTFR